MKKSEKITVERKRPARPPGRPMISGKLKPRPPISSVRSSPPKTINVFLVQLPETSRTAVRNAATNIFPAAQFIETRNVIEATQQAIADGPQLLVLTDANETEIALATQTTDAGDLPRWAVVILGQNFTDMAESLALDECHTPALARTIRSAMRQHELLRENLQLRGDLKTVARRVRHDLMSPLNCIYLSCEVLKELLPAEPPTIQSQLGVIHRSLSETCLLIDRVSEILKASADPLPLTCVAMGAVVDNVLRSLETEIQQKGAHIRRPSQWPDVLGVGKWLEMIWWNLIVNALRHGLSPPSIQLGWEQKKEALRFWVVSRGSAVPVELETSLFKRFDQLHMQPSRGLGLSLIHRLVSLQGGHCGYKQNGDDILQFYFTMSAIAK